MTASISQYVTATDARMRRLENNLDVVIRAITAEHANGNPGRSRPLTSGLPGALTPGPFPYCPWMKGPGFEKLTLTPYHESQTGRAGEKQEEGAGLGNCVRLDTHGIEPG